jgi:hypothetical protein
MKRERERALTEIRSCTTGISEGCVVQLKLSISMFGA